MDFTPMYAAHDAFRRDLDRLITAAKTGLGADPTVRAGWNTFKEQLDIHHRAEDTALWPPMRERVASRPDDLAALDAMQAEHARIDPLLEAIEVSLGAPALLEHATALSEALNAHLAHEEEEALPMISATEWGNFTTYIRKQQGFRGAAVYLPWLLDDAEEDDDRTRMMRSLPAPARLLYRLRWLPSYRRTPRWTALSA